MSFQFPDLPYDFNALEPYIDAQTMEIHYGKHHRAYFDKFMAAVKDTAMADAPLESILAEISRAPVAVRNNGGGFYNHIMYWNCMTATSSGKPDGALAVAIDGAFGSFDAFKEKMSTEGLNRFGSGFAWLIVKDGKLEVTSTANQDNPLMDVAPSIGKPILALDVWEHAYYLKYQNKRPDYIANWWNVVNWEFVAAEYQKAVG